MKLFVAITGVALLTSMAGAETFLCSSNHIQTLTVASNEAIIISAARTTFDGGPDFSGKITMAGKTNSLWMDSYNTDPVAIAGPAVLTLSNSVAVFFTRLPGTIVHSLYVSQNQTNTGTINIPSGQTCRFFHPVGPNGSGFPPVTIGITSGTQSVAGIQLYGAEEISGPATVNPIFDCGLCSGTAAIVSYYFTQAASIVPELGLQGPTGSFEIVIEKSVALTNWTPVVIHATSSDETSAFYRLRISK